MRVLAALHAAPDPAPFVMLEMEHLSASYLYAIQNIPGETRPEKCKEIGQIVNRVIKSMQVEIDFTSALDTEKVPTALVHLIKVLVGVKIESSAFIIEALKSNDIHLITEALRAKWFYDGSCKNITNYIFYSTDILPFVSMSTRREIIKRLAVGLAEQSALAEEFFSGFVADYGVQEATNLLPACRSEFIYNSIVNHKIFLTNKLLSKLYLKYPDLVIRYLRFADPCERKDDVSRLMFKIVDINEYENFLPLLVTKYPQFFVDMQKICHISASLGNRRAKMFLKNAKQILIKEPRDIIELMPFKLVYDSLTQEEFETMFGNLCANQWDTFNIDEMLNYLEYYPEDKRATLLRTKVKENYNFDLFERVEKLSHNFLLLLPKEERFTITRKIIEVRYKMEMSDSETSWWCYLPIEEAIPALKTQIARNWKSSKQQNFFSQLIFVCKLNDSKEALLNVLRYVDEEFKNERSDVICRMLDSIAQEFDLSTLDERYWSILFSIIKRVKLKKETARDYWVLIKILKKNVHYCVENNLPYNEIIDILIKLFLEGRVGVSWLLLEDEAEYERKYLDVCFRHSYWLNMDYKKNVVEGIYSFNERHVKDDNTIQRFSIKDYPNLLKVVEETLKKQQKEECNWITYTKEKLKLHEPELYKTWFPDESDTHSEIKMCYSDLFDDDDDSSFEEQKKDPPEIKKIIYLTEAIIALKRNYSEIKENWPQYYGCCKKEVSSKKRRRVKYFLKALRWYQDIPIKFAESAISDKNFGIMAFLLDGPTFASLAQKGFSMESDVDSFYSHQLASKIVGAIRNAYSPIPIDLVQNHLHQYQMYSYKNYINDGLKLWSYVSYRTSSDKMIILSKNLAKDKFFMKKHAIRLMYAMATTNDIVDFFMELWKTEKHPMIREMLANKIKHLFTQRPCERTWKLMSTCIESLSISEDKILIKLMGSTAVPVEFASPFTKQIFKKIQNYIKQGLRNYDGAKILDQLFGNLKPNCTDQLSEDCYRELIDYYLENLHLEFNNAVSFIVKVYLDFFSIYFEDRLKYITHLLKTESERWYGTPLLKRKHSNNFVENLVQVVVYQVERLKGSLKLVENLLNIFDTIFTPFQHVSSYVMLFLCAEYLRVEPSFKNFGISISEKISILLDRYAPEYFMYIVEFINKFVSNFNFYEYATTVKERQNFLEGLYETKNQHGLLIAAKLIHDKFVGDCDLQLCEILQQLSKVNNPLVQSIL